MNRRLFLKALAVSPLVLVCAKEKPKEGLTLAKLNKARDWIIANEDNNPNMLYDPTEIWAKALREAMRKKRDEIIYSSFDN